MPGFNKVILMGNLVADPELKKTPSDVSVTSLRIAVGRRYAGKDGNNVTDFFDVVCWRQTAEFVCKYFTKGRAILVSGQLQQRSWTDQNGQKRYTVEVVAEEVSFVDRKTDNGAGNRDNGVYYGEPPAEQYGSQAPSAGFEDVPTEDDLPF